MKADYLNVAEKIHDLYTDCLFDEELSELKGEEEQDFLIALSYIQLASYIVKRLALSERDKNE